MQALPSHPASPVQPQPLPSICIRITLPLSTTASSTSAGLNQQTRAITHQNPPQTPLPAYSPPPPSTMPEMSQIPQAARQALCSSLSLVIRPCHLRDLAQPSRPFRLARWLSHCPSSGALPLALSTSLLCRSFSSVSSCTAASIAVNQV